MDDDTAPTGAAADLGEAFTAAGRQVTRMTRGPESDDRFGASLSCYYQTFGENPATVAARYAAAVPKNADGPYARRLRIGPEWRPLDYGWLAGGRIGALAVENRAGRGRADKPSAEERAAAAAQVIRIRRPGETGDGWAVPAGGFLFASPGTDAPVEVRCEAGEVAVNYTVFPG